jgi:hypothetical protein
MQEKPTLFSSPYLARRREAIKSLILFHLWSASAQASRNLRKPG